MHSISLIVTLLPSSGKDELESISKGIIGESGEFLLPPADDPYEWTDFSSSAFASRCSDESESGRVRFGDTGVDDLRLLVLLLRDGIDATADRLASGAWEVVPLP